MAPAGLGLRDHRSLRPTKPALQAGNHTPLTPAGSLHETFAIVASVFLAGSARWLEPGPPGLVWVEEGATDLFPTVATDLRSVELFSHRPEVYAPLSLRGARSLTVYEGTGLPMPSSGLWEQAEAGCRSAADMQ